MSTPSAHRHDRPADSRSGWPQGTLSAANQCESDWIGGCVCFHVRMSQALAEHEVFDAGSRKGARRGVILGVVATLVLAVAAWGADQVLSSGPRTFTTTCSGANVTGMIWVDASGVFTSASVVDPEGRRWDVRVGRLCRGDRGLSHGLSEVRTRLLGDSRERHPNARRHR